MQVGLFTQVISNRARGNGATTGNNSTSCASGGLDGILVKISSGAVKPWNKLLREMVESQSLEESKRPVDVAFGDMV